MRVLITGASKGIGLATTEHLAKLGYKVYATVRNPEGAEALQKLASQYPNIFISQLDVTEGEEIIFHKIRAIGEIDIVINNAGIAVCGPAEAATETQRKSIFETNYHGVVNVVNAVLPNMRERNSGRIITISSVVGPLPDPFLPDYSASKAAIESWTAVLRRNLIGTNIIVSNVHPGPVLTEIEAATPDASRFLNADVNPYPQFNSEDWRKIMRNGRPVQETVETIMRVITEKNPDPWNPTEKAVTEQLSRVYKNTTGKDYMAGLPIPTSIADKTSIATLIEHGGAVSKKIVREKEEGKVAPMSYTAGGSNN